jgi:hypothetical protein
MAYVGAVHIHIKGRGECIALVFDIEALGNDHGGYEFSEVLFDAGTSSSRKPSAKSVRKASVSMSRQTACFTSYVSSDHRGEPFYRIQETRTSGVEGRNTEGDR